MASTISLAKLPYFINFPIRRKEASLKIPLLLTVAQTAPISSCLLLALSSTLQPSKLPTL
jgi:hypothetical protein